MNRFAPDGEVFVCRACGKQSKDLYGTEKISAGWDESCMLNAVLCYEHKRFDANGLLTWHAVSHKPDGGTTMTPHPVIWLQPSCEACAGAGDRTWCQDPVYDACPDCGTMPVKYVLAPDQPLRAEEKL